MTLRHLIKCIHEREQQMYRHALVSKSFNRDEMREIEMSYAPRMEPLVFGISELFQLDHIDTININLEQTPSLTLCQTAMNGVSAMKVFISQQIHCACGGLFYMQILLSDYLRN